MSFKKTSGRQQTIVAYADIDFSQLVSGVFKGLIEVPAGAVVIGGDVVVDTVWNSGTSDALVVGDAAVTNRYKTSYSIQALGRTALVPTGFKNTGPTLIGVAWTGVSTAPTTGAARVMVEYFVRGRTQFAQGLDN